MAPMKKIVGPTTNKQPSTKPAHVLPAQLPKPGKGGQ